MKDRQPMKLDVTPLEDAVAQLEESLEIYHSDIALIDPRLKKHLRASVIQAFKFTYELSVKMLKRYIEHTSTNPAFIDTLTFKDIIREAYGQALLSEEVSKWEEFRKNRGTTSQTYREDKAQTVFDSVPNFLQEAKFLLSQLHKRTDDHD